MVRPFTLVVVIALRLLASLHIILRARLLLKLLIFISLSVLTLSLHALLKLLGMRLPVHLHRLIDCHLAARFLLRLAPETIERVWTLVWEASRRPLGIIVAIFMPWVVRKVPRCLLIIGALLILKKWRVRVVGRLLLLVIRLVGKILMILLLLQLVGETALLIVKWVSSGFDRLFFWLT